MREGNLPVTDDGTGPAADWDAPAVQAETAEGKASMGALSFVDLLEAPEDEESMCSFLQSCFHSFLTFLC